MIRGIKFKFNLEYSLKFLLKNIKSGRFRIFSGRFSGDLVGDWIVV